MPLGPVALQMMGCNDGIMSSATIAFLAFTFQFAGVVDHFEDISPQIAAERVARCGIGPARITFDRELQSHVLSVPDASAATDEQLACADKAVSHYELELPAATQARYNAIRRERLTALAVGEAKAWLAAKGLLERVPKYTKGTSDDLAFSREVEKLCGPRAKGAFASPDGPHVLSGAWLERELRPDAPESDVLACLMNVATVADFRVGIIGNEAAPRPARRRRYRRWRATARRS